MYIRMFYVLIRVMTLKSHLLLIWFLELLIKPLFALSVSVIVGIELVG